MTSNEAIRQAESMGSKVSPCDHRAYAWTELGGKAVTVALSASYGEIARGTASSYFVACKRLAAAIRASVPGADLGPCW